jgi:hypothetical protein
VRAILSISALVLSLSTFCQPIGNEWIVYDQHYLKIELAETFQSSNGTGLMSTEIAWQMGCTCTE